MNYRFLILQSKHGSHACIQRPYPPNFGLGRSAFSLWCYVWGTQHSWVPGEMLKFLWKNQSLWLNIDFESNLSTLTSTVPSGVWVYAWCFSNVARMRKVCCQPFHCHCHLETCRASHSLLVEKTRMFILSVNTWCHSVHHSVYCCGTCLRLAPAYASLPSFVRGPGKQPGLDLCANSVVALCCFGTRDPK